MKIDKYRDLKIMLNSSDSNGCGFMRVKQPAEFLKQHLPWTEYALGFPPNDPRTAEADVIQLQRACNDFFKEWIPAAKNFGKKVYSDIDDLMWGIPASNLAHRHYPRKELDKLDWIFRNSDAITTSTVPLAEFLNKRFGIEPIVIPNMYHAPKPFIKLPNEKVRIGWHGSYTHNGDFDHHLCNVLRDLVKNHNVEFHTFGFCPKYLKDIAIHTEWADIDNFIDVLIGLNLDIGIIVAEDNDFNKCKSNLKFIEYGLAKTVSVAHNVYPYATTIEHGVDGFLVKNKKTDWKEYLTLLVKDEELRKSIALKANEKVLRDFTFEGNGELILDQYSLLFERLGF
jgi:glycosyltransferase involved in cell wall biosynthesis